MECRMKRAFETAERSLINNSRVSHSRCKLPKTHANQSTRLGSILIHLHGCIQSCTDV